jgi:DNA-binding PadR family transcriptional regulator
LVNAEKEILKATIRGFNRVTILWLISNKPMSGYAVVKEMEQQLTGQKFHQGLIAGKWTHRGDVRIKNYMVSEKGLKLLGHLREVFQLPIKEDMEDLIGEKTQPPNAGQD